MEGGFDFDLLMDALALQLPMDDDDDKAKTQMKDGSSCCFYLLTKQCNVSKHVKQKTKKDKRREKIFACLGVKKTNFARLCIFASCVEGQWSGGQ